MKFAALFIALSAVPGCAFAQDRFVPMTQDQMSPEQKAIAAAIVASRGNMGGPFDAWLREPELADRLQKLGEQIRFHASLPPELNEFAILITARHWTSQFEWYAHYPLAMKAGLDPAIAADLADGERPRNMPDDVATVYDFSMQLHATGNVNDDVYASAVKKFSEKGVIDLIAVNGYYDLVSMTLNVAHVGVPAGASPPLKSLRDE
jgi:4-carboxymuconolactone decarboxylase